MKHCLLFYTVIFQVLLLSFLGTDLGIKEIVPYLLLKSFQPYFSSSLSGGYVVFNNKITNSMSKPFQPNVLKQNAENVPNNNF